MKTDQIIDAIGGIDEELVLSALETRRVVEVPAQTDRSAEKSRRKRRGLTAAAMLLAVFVAFIAILPGSMGYTVFRNVIKSESGMIYYHSYKKNLFGRPVSKGTYAYSKEGIRTKLDIGGHLISTAEGPMLLTNSLSQTSNKIYRLSGTQVQLLGSIEAKVEGANYRSDFEIIDIKGDDVYYVHHMRVICKENIKTNDMTVLIPYSDEMVYSAGNVAVCNSYLFYRSDWGIEALDLKTGKTVRVFDPPESEKESFGGQHGWSVYGDRLIITGQFGIYIIDCDTLQVRKICTISASIEHDCYKGKIYCNTSGGFAAIDIETGDVLYPLNSKVVDGSEITVVDGGCYYSRSGPVGFGLYYCDFETQAITQID